MLESGLRGGTSEPDDLGSTRSDATYFSGIEGREWPPKISSSSSDDAIGVVAATSKSDDSSDSNSDDDSRSSERDIFIAAGAKFARGGISKVGTDS